MEIKSKEVQLVDVDAIVPWDRNNNQHPDDQIERLAKLIKHNGFRDPLIVSKRSGFLIAGHGRLEAAKKLGMEKVPVSYQDFQNEAEEYQFMTAHNAIASWATIDLAQVNADLGDLGPELDIEMLGIKDFTIEPMESFDDEIPSDDGPKKYLLEVELPTEMDLRDLYDDLSSKGYMVKEK